MNQKKKMAIEGNWRRSRGHDRNVLNAKAIRSSYQEYDEWCVELSMSMKRINYLWEEKKVWRNQDGLDQFHIHFTCIAWTKLSWEKYNNPNYESKLIKIRQTSKNTPTIASEIKLIQCVWTIKMFDLCSIAIGKAPLPDKIIIKPTNLTSNLASPLEAADVRGFPTE